MLSRLRQKQKPEIVYEIFVFRVNWNTLTESANAAIKCWLLMLNTGIK